MSTPPSRKAIRKELAALLAANVPSVQSVYDYAKPDLEGETPVILVTGMGIERPRMTLQGNKTTIYLVAELFVLYSDEATGWTPDQAEDALDDLEQEVAVVLQDYKSHDGYWKTAYYGDRSQIAKLPIGGYVYLYEVLPFNMEVLS